MGLHCLYLSYCFIIISHISAYDSQPGVVKPETMKTSQDDLQILQAKKSQAAPPGKLSKKRGQLVRLSQPPAGYASGITDHNRLRFVGNEMERDGRSDMEFLRGM